MVSLTTERVWGIPNEVAADPATQATNNRNGAFEL